MKKVILLIILLKGLNSNCADNADNMNNERDKISTGFIGAGLYGLYLSMFNSVDYTRCITQTVPAGDICNSIKGTTILGIITSETLILAGLALKCRRQNRQASNLKKNQ